MVAPGGFTRVVFQPLCMKEIGTVMLHATVTVASEYNLNGGTENECIPCRAQGS